jgi:hypothetical protein
LVFPDQLAVEEIVTTMVAEASQWLRRYPIPVMVSAFDDTGVPVHLAPTQGCDHLMALPGREGEQPQLSWRLLRNDELPENGEDVQHLKQVYAGVPYKTGRQLRLEAQRRARSLKVGWSIFFVWLVIVPAIIAILGVASLWVGVVAMLYSLCRATVKGLKLTGRWKPSPREVERREDERLMRHHHYHCKLNPAGFRRLMLENLENDEREAIRHEAEMLKSARSTEGNGDPNNGLQADGRTSRRPQV